METDTNPPNEVRVCAVPGIYPCAGCDGREDPTFGTEIEPGNGICIGSDCADVSLWADAADANEGTHRVIVPGAGNNALSADEIRAFLQNPVPDGAQDGCIAGAVPLAPEKTEEEKAAEAAELARLTQQLAQRAAAHRQRAAQQSEDVLLQAIQNDEAWLDNRSGDYYLSQEEAIEGALKAIGREYPNLSSYEALQMVSIVGPRGNRIGAAAPSAPPQQPPREPPSTVPPTKVKTKRKTKSRETEFEVLDPTRDEVIAVYKTRRGAENRAAKNASFGHYVREVPIRERDHRPQSRKATPTRTIEFEVFHPVSGETIAIYKTRRGAENRIGRDPEYHVREVPAGSVKVKAKSKSRKTKTKSRRKTKTKSRRRKTKTKSRRRKTKTKSRRRKTKTKSRRRKTKSRRRKTKTKSRRRKTKTKSRRRKTKTKSRRRKTKTKSRRRGSSSVRPGPEVYEPWYRMGPS